MAPVFDTTIVVINVAVHIEPYPFGYITGSDRAFESDMWSCMPGIATIAGVTCIDFLTHQNIITLGTNANYAMHHLDLMPPSVIPNILSLAQQSKMPLPVDGEWVKVADWLNSDSYYKSMMQTPTLPCRECLLHNRAAEGRPIRPDSKPPKSLKKGTPWHKYETDIKRLLSILKRAVRLHLSRFYTTKEIKAYLRDRTSGYKGKLEIVKNGQRRIKIMKKVRLGKPLTKREQLLYRR